MTSTSAAASTKPCAPGPRGCLAHPPAAHPPCAQAELCFDNQSYYRSLMEYFGCYTLHPSLGKREALASSAVRAADKIDAALIIVFTVTGQTARLVAKYKPACPILTVSSGRRSSGNAAAECCGGPADWGGSSGGLGVVGAGTGGLASCTILERRSVR